MNFRHGHTRDQHHSVEYLAWRNMLNRCFYKKGEKYLTYGARGITVCMRWRKSFSNFLTDMGLRPNGKTIDRKNNDGNYTPKNCRWATRSEQARNRRVTDLFRKSLSKFKNVSKSKTSGLPKGVCLVKGKYVARVAILGTGIGGRRSKIKHLGTFRTIELAANAVRRAECPKK